MAKGGTGHPITLIKTAMEEDKEHSAQDVLLFHLEHQWTAHTSSSILVPGYKMYHFSANVFMANGNKMGILYTGIRIIEEV
jgi:hypothetical protein